MSKLSFLANILTIPTIALGAIAAFSGVAKGANTVKVSCDTKDSVPKIIATLFNQEHSASRQSGRTQTFPILSFLPKYFSSQEAVFNCQTAAKLLQNHYSEGKMNYLASDTINGKPVVCSVQRRGLSCDSYSSEILFSLDKQVSPTKMLYDMLGKNFKGSQVPSSRTVSRIYTDLKPSWWPSN